MKEFPLTVFTEPLSATGFIPRVKSFAKLMRGLIQGKFERKKYGGHYAVTRSLIEGLQKINAPFNYNPNREKDIFENVLVLAGVERLKHAIQLKKAGKLLTLAAGPNVVEDVRSENQLAADPAIDRYIVPSRWVEDLVINDCEKLKDRVRVWYAGIDTEYWKPVIEVNLRQQVLIYWKTEPEEFYQKVVAVLEQRQIPHTTIRYGNYTQPEYKTLLGKSRLAIFISRSESQGIALAEAWSMDVPSYVFDPGEFFFTGRMIHNVSASPYLVREAGKTWNSIHELEQLLDDKNSLAAFSPRKYALEKFTDAYCARQLLDVLRK